MAFIKKGATCKVIKPMFGVGFEKGDIVEVEEVDSDTNIALIYYCVRTSDGLPQWVYRGQLRTIKSVQ